MKHLLSIEDLSRSELDELLDLAASFLSVTQRETPKVPALRGRTVVSLFFEDSTRTRTSFELAGKRLGADVLNMSVSTSSVNKGETLLDTAKNIEAMIKQPIGEASKRKILWDNAARAFNLN